MMEQERLASNNQPAECLLFANTDGNPLLKHIEGRVQGKSVINISVRPTGGNESVRDSQFAPRELISIDVTPVPELHPDETNLQVHPGDLTGVSIEFSKALEKIESGAPDAVCFDSIHILLQYNSVDNIFRFLSTLSHRCKNQGTSLYVSIDSSAVSEGDYRTFWSLFSDVIEA